MDEATEVVVSGSGRECSSGSGRFGELVVPVRGGSAGTRDPVNGTRGEGVLGTRFGEGDPVNGTRGEGAPVNGKGGGEGDPVNGTRFGEGDPVNGTRGGRSCEWNTVRGGIAGNTRGSNPVNGTFFPGVAELVVPVR